MLGFLLLLRIAVASLAFTLLSLDCPLLLSLKLVALDVALEWNQWQYEEAKERLSVAMPNNQSLAWFLASFFAGSFSAFASFGSL